MMDQVLKERLDKTAANMAKIVAHLKEETNTFQGDHVELIRHFNDIRNAHDILSDAKKALTEVHDLLSREMVPEAMRAAGVKTTTVEGVGRVTISHRYSCSMLDKDQGLAWLKDNGHADLIQETVNASTLAAFSRNLIEEEGIELPPDVFKVGTSPFTSVTKK